MYGEAEETDGLLHDVEFPKKNLAVVEAAPRELNGNVATSVQITNSMIGSGILTFPYVLAHVGFFWAAIFMVTFGLSVYWTSVMLIYAGKRRGILDYSRIVEAEFGYTTARVLDVSIALTNFGALMSYFNTIGTLGSYAVSQWGNVWLLQSYSGFMIVLCMGIEIPIIMLRSYGELTMFSFGSLVFVISVVVFVAIQGKYADSSDFMYSNIWPNRWIDCIKFLGNFSYAYSCQAVVFEAYQSMKPAARVHFNSSMGASTILGGVLLTSMAIFGYAAFGQSCESDILVNFNTDTWEVQTCFLVIVAHLLLYIPNDFVIMRLFFMRIFSVDALLTTQRTHIVATLILFMTPLAIMASVPEADVGGIFSLVIDLTGDIPSGFSCFFLPSVLYIKVFEKDGGFLWYIAWPIAVIGAVLVIICPCVDISSYMDACATNAGCSKY